MDLLTLKAMSSYDTANTQADLKDQHIVKSEFEGLLPNNPDYLQVQINEQVVKKMEEYMDEGCEVVNKQLDVMKK